MKQPCSQGWSLRASRNILRDLGMIIWRSILVNNSYCIALTLMKNRLDGIYRLDTLERRVIWFILKSIRLKHDWDNYWIDLYQRLYSWLIWNMYSKVKVDWHKLYIFCWGIFRRATKDQRYDISIHLFYIHLCMYLSSIYLPIIYLSTYFFLLLEYNCFTMLC